MSSSEHELVIVRYSKNPILTAHQWPYPIHSVFNPGATRLKDGRFLLLCRCEDRRGFSHLCAARSRDGLTDWEIDPSPTLLPDPERYPEELYGIEDPRITYVEELGRYFIAYTAYSRGGPGVALASTEDFVTFERFGMVMPPDDKDAALFPHRIGDRFALIHRPTTEQDADMWISYSPDMQNWGSHKLMMRARRGGWWDARKIGLAAPPLRTDRGWLVLYHGVRVHASGSIYRLGAALFDLDNPEICLRRGAPWIMAPEEPYEIVGDVPYVIFPCGAIVLDDGDTVRLYYGGADSCVAAAEFMLSHLLDWLERHGSEPHDAMGDHEEQNRNDV